MKRCTAAIGSLTNAIKAQRALSQAEIECTIVKLDASMTRKGCAYGLEFICEQIKTVRATLNAEKINVTGYINGGGGSIV